jgi:hypothetical protein
MDVDALTRNKHQMGAKTFRTTIKRKAAPLRQLNVLTGAFKVSWTVVTGDW